MAMQGNDMLDFDIRMDQRAWELSQKIRVDLKRILKETPEEEESDLKDALLEDDRCLEELTDRLAFLNVLEAASGGRLQHGGEDPDGAVSKEELENGYLLLMDSFFKISKILNPLAGFGLDRLKTGLSLIAAFEKLYWPVVTRITPENAAPFRDFIPEEHFDDLIAGRKRALGALRHIGEGVYATGAVVYSIPYTEAGDTPLIRVDWIQVHEKMQGKGIGNFLMAQVLELALQNEGTGVWVELPVKQFETEEEKEEAAVLYGFLDGWKFGFSVSSGTRFVIRLSDINTGRMSGLETDLAESLSALGRKGPEVLSDYLASLGNDCDEELLKLPFDFFDPSVSCVIRENGKIRIALLVHRFENGDYRYEALRSRGKTDQVDVVELIRFAGKAALEESSADNFVFGHFASEEGAEIASRILPDGKALLTYSGLLLPEEESITTEEWDALRKQAGLLKDRIPEEGLNEDSLGEEELKQAITFVTNLEGQENG